MGADLVIADRLTRAFADRVAVRDLSLAVGAGEIVSLLGPNGAGKTTTMRMLAGLILPTSGRISINRVELSAATAGMVRSAVGLLTEAPGLWERLTVRANLLVYARLHGLNQPGQRVDDVLRQVDLADRAEDAAGKLSKGLKQRVAIARALVHEPPVVLLDEPTSGLDPASARDMRDLILGLKNDGRAVLVCTHNLAEAEELSDRIAILKTELLACDSVDNLRKAKPGLHVAIETEGAPVQSIPIGSLAEIPDIVDRLVASGARIVSVIPQQRSLEDVYLDLVGADR